MLVADDRVEVEDGIARPPPQLAGLLEVRGLGIMRLPHVQSARLALAVDLGVPPPRLPAPAKHPEFGVPLIAIDARSPSAAQRVALALDCVLGCASQVVGAFAP